MMRKTNLSSSYFCGNCTVSPARKIEVGTILYVYLCDKCLKYIANPNHSGSMSGMDVNRYMEQKKKKVKVLESGFKQVRRGDQPLNKNEVNVQKIEPVVFDEEELQELEKSYQKQFQKFKGDGLNNLRKPKKCMACGVTYNDGVGCLCSKRW
jgi:hypothetical protein